ncbi:MAG: peptidyl-prolyl cis-trans isomerase [Gemmatimonadaceae bacterium]|nr:peptidyl-prolyl cis-trans isomerase [Gemmatimonadaceae bacterium]
MTRLKILATSFAAIVGLTACDGLKEALTAHVDVVARSGSQELSVTRLAELMGGSEVMLRRDVARSIATLWSNYQLVAAAGAHGDTGFTNAEIDKAMWAGLAQVKSKKFYDRVAASWVFNDSSQNEAKYNAGELLAARHILFAAPQNGFTQQKRDSIKNALVKLRAGLTPTNFAAIAEKQSMDPGSRTKGGDLGVFPKGMMVPEFEKAILALKPGEISGIVETQFGYHVILRSTWAQAKGQFNQSYNQVAAQAAESTFLAQLEEKANVQVSSGAAKTVRALVEDVDGYRKDKSTLATWKGGELTAARLAQWVMAFPGSANIRGQLQQAPDSVVPFFIKNIVRNELVLHAADSAKIGVDSAELAEVRNAFRTDLQAVMAGLGVMPAQLADSAKTEAERERVAAGRADAYVQRLLERKAQFFEVRDPVVTILRDKYEARVVASGLDRAVERATKLRAQLDSTKASKQPATAVPTPPAAGATPPAPVPTPAAKP